ncbi:PaaI family thioesterase [soil metagenome]
MTLIARDPDFEARVRTSFATQRFMSTLGARLDRVELGEVAIALAFREDLTQQNGFLHAGVGASIVDSACGYAALTVMEPGRNVLSVEFKVNMLAPAKGAEFVATGRVVRSGRTLVVVTGELTADGSVVMLMQGTMTAA